MLTKCDEVTTETPASPFLSNALFPLQRPSSKLASLLLSAETWMVVIGFIYSLVLQLFWVDVYWPHCLEAAQKAELKGILLNGSWAASTTGSIEEEERAWIGIDCCTGFPFAKPARMASTCLDSTAAGKIRGTIRCGISNICVREERERERGVKMAELLNAHLKVGGHLDLGNGKFVHESVREGRRKGDCGSR
ncbi:uncharacterized protein MONOS_8609 [Monocercomonoides exilis]|uniref:uncharacterized protein n=1 Tax=Monocercomonoides exilis TaxID=2049356 RepID=UPI003559FD10|nr:hypothetical protein MONOS_8609 [Monocercomonoides exilis]|eukprot:MONOS_8609.1-p1 / transcript=MONOS_8609.1 / gene=MONOS_8609 / organism=Monocercomonoides_exilis_PA203 / gene_product=unspecified product / transcript_product=unspecified product / location=Mono_scaffold00328:52389-53355(-) / protein_length=193 / sequence_SO=supercontig / SO=protein_coding / is_pseudo=false